MGKIRIANPLDAFRPCLVWCWNSRISKVEIKKQLEEIFRQRIYDFFIMPGWGYENGYLNNDYFQKIKTVVSEARKLNMRYWIYDEYSWPSGSAGGYVLKDYPQYTAMVLLCIIREKTNRSEVPGKVLLRQRLSEKREIIFSEATTKEVPPSSIYARFSWTQRGFLDVLSSAAVKKFIDYTHERYYARFGKDFGRLIPGIFTDEPGFYPRWEDEQNKLPPSKRSCLGFPWTRNLFKMFQEKHGYDLRPKLPELVFDGGCHAKTRFDYWKLVTDTFVGSYTKQVFDWCRRHRIKLTGHLFLEEDFLRSTFHEGDLYAHLKYFHIPGVDSIYSKQRMYGREANVGPKLVSSVAHLCNRDYILSETYTGSGWGLNFQDMKKVFDWLAVLGCNRLQFQCGYYTIKGFRKVQERCGYPPSHLNQQPFWKYYHVFSDYVACTCRGISEGAHRADIAVLYPTTSVWCEINWKGTSSSRIRIMQDSFITLTNNLLKLRRDFDVIFEEVLINKAKIENGKILVGKESYSMLILPSLTALTENLFRRIEKFVQQGGHVLVLNFIPWQTPDDWNIIEDMQKLFKVSVRDVNDRIINLNNPARTGRRYESRLVRKDRASFILSNDIVNKYNPGFIKTLGNFLKSFPAEVDFGKNGENIWMLQRSLARAVSFYMVNRGPKTINTSVHLSLKGIPQIFDPVKGETRFTAFRKENKGIRVPLRFSPYESLFLIIEKGKKTGIAPKERRKKIREYIIPANWNFSTERSNMKRLVLSVKQNCHGRWLSCGEKGIFPFKEELKPGENYELQGSFSIKDTPNHLELITEQIEPGELTINGIPAGEGKETFVWDNSNIGFDISKYVKKGSNTIRFQTRTPDYKVPNTPPFIALYGDFVVADDLEITRTQGGTASGDWTKFGYPHYSGTGIYSQSIYLNKAGKEKEVILEVEKARDVVEVYINNHPAGVRLWTPYRFDISGKLRKGTNQIQIKITNTLSNLFEKSLPSGLLGKTKIIVYEKLTESEELFPDESYKK
ncbi:MAG: glycosyl hydrolase [Candidatus Omnitrophota bacterium]